MQVTQVRYGGWTYQAVFGPGQVQAWHHYQLIWDVDGNLPGVPDPTRKVAVFLDGTLDSTHWYVPGPHQSSFSPITSGTLGLLQMTSGLSVTQGSYAIDELRVWNVVRAAPEMP